MDYYHLLAVVKITTNSFKLKYIFSIVRYKFKWPVVEDKYLVDNMISFPKVWTDVCEKGKKFKLVS